MARPIGLFTGPWTDLPLEELVARAGDWGYQGLELACWGDHFEVQRAHSEADYCQRKLDLLARHDLTVLALANHRVGQAVGDPLVGYQQALLPDYVWGDGQSRAVQSRAAEEMATTVRVAQKLGVGVVVGYTGSPLWPLVGAGYPPLAAVPCAALLEDFAARWHPILDVCRECGVRFALEVQPGQIAFDLTSAALTLQTLQDREEFGFALDPVALQWQGIDPAEFVRQHGRKIIHVHARDLALTLNGRSGLLNGYLPVGDPRRGWDARSPGHGGVDWEGLIRALNAVGYDGPLVVDWADPGMDRDYGAEDACRFLKRLDFEPAPRGDQSAFHDN